MRFPRGLIVILIIVVLVPLGSALLFEKVMPHQIGVKQVKLGSVGVVEQDYDAGFHLGVSGVHLWYFLPRKTHFLHFKMSQGRPDETTMWLPPLATRTKDNNETVIECTIPYRIKDGEAHLIVKNGLRLAYPGRVQTTVDGLLRAQLAELSSEELQDTATRLKRAEETLPLLNRELENYHVVADAILIRRVSFQPEYEAQLQEKQFLTQKANLDGALALVANEEKVTNSIEKQISAAEARLTADWDKQFQEESSRFEVLIAEINAQARVYESRTKAEGDAERVKLEAEGQLAVDQARALRDRLRNEALGTRGGRIFLALQAAENLQVPHVMLNSNDPRVPLIIDLDEMTGLLLGDAPPDDG